MNHFLFSPPLLKALTALLPDPGSPREAWPHRPQAPTPFSNSPSLQVQSVLGFLLLCSKQYPEGPQLFWYVVPGPIPAPWLAGPLTPLSLVQKSTMNRAGGRGKARASRLGRSHRSVRPCPPRPNRPAPRPQALREPPSPCPAPTFWAVGKPPLQLARCIGEPGRRWQGRRPPPDYVSVVCPGGRAGAPFPEL